jgi:hypothetical protein
MVTAGFILLALFNAGPSPALGLSVLVPQIRSAVTASGGRFMVAIVETRGRVECHGADGDLVCATRATLIRVVASSESLDDHAGGLSLRIDAKSVELNEDRKTLLVFTTPVSWTNRVVIALAPTPENVETLRTAVDLALGRPIEIEQRSTMPNIRM